MTGGRSSKIGRQRFVFGKGSGRSSGALLTVLLQTVCRQQRDDAVQTFSQSVWKTDCPWDRATGRRTREERRCREHMSWTDTGLCLYIYASRQWLHHDVTLEPSTMFHLNVSSNYLPLNTRPSLMEPLFTLACVGARVQRTKKCCSFMYMEISACSQK